MGLAIAAVALGAVLGLAAGGRPADLGRCRTRAGGALVAAVLLQLAASIAGGDATATVLVLTSYSLLLGCALANLRLVGMPVVVLGLLLNAGVIAVNGGMPVRPEALRAVGEEQVGELDLGAKRHLEDDSDRLTFLGDVVPVRPLGTVLSFGDLVLGAGIANVVFRALRPPYRRRRPAAPEVPPDVLIDLVASTALLRDPRTGAHLDVVDHVDLVDLDDDPADERSGASPVPVGVSR